MAFAHGSHVSVLVNKYSKAPDSSETSIALLVLPPVSFSTASHTEKQSGKEKQTLSIFQIERVDKQANHEFPDKIVFSFEGRGRCG